MSDTSPEQIADYEAVPPYGSDPIRAADAVRLLGAARVVLDRCAEDRASRGEAADMAQRIVDLIGHSTTDEPPHALVLIEELADAISEAVDFFVARDEMNAKVHLAPARWSPITEQCRHALESWRNFRYPELNDGSGSPDE